MAQLSRSRRENIAGSFYVDDSCIDCDTCRFMAPGVFSQVGDMSAVTKQPQNPKEKMQALGALLSCPTASIGTIEREEKLKEVRQSFPLLVDGPVYHNGFHSQKSYGATSYFVKHPAGNILVDSPKFVGPLVRNLEKMGGIKYMYLTHQDDVADHEKFARHFGCQRIIHQSEKNSVPNAEIVLNDDDFALAKDLLILHVPGHTKGHTCLLYKNKYLFTGDHLAYSWRLQQLYAFRRACWYSWPVLIESMQKLQQYRFTWVLPGHGRRYHTNAEQMQQELDKCISWMKKQ